MKMLELKVRPVNQQVKKSVYKQRWENQLVKKNMLLEFEFE